MNIPHECSEIFRKTKKYSRLSRSNICSYTTSIWSIWLTDSLNRGQVIIVIWTLTAFELYQMLFCVMKTECISKYQKLLLTHSHQITFKEKNLPNNVLCVADIPLNKYTRMDLLDMSGSTVEKRTKRSISINARVYFWKKVVYIMICSCWHLNIFPL